MKRLIVSLLALMVMLSLASCAKFPPQLEEPWQEAYLSLIIERYEEVQKREDFVSLSYALLDLTSDGTPELFFPDKNGNSVYTYQSDSVIEIVLPEKQFESERYPFAPYPFRNLLTNKIHWFYRIGEVDMISLPTHGYAELVFDSETLQPTLHERLKMEGSDFVYEDDKVAYVDLECFVEGELVSLDEYEQALWEWNKTHLEIDGLRPEWYGFVSSEKVVAALADWKPFVLPELPSERSEVAYPEIHTATAPETKVEVETTTEPWTEFDAAVQTTTDMQVP